MRKPCIGVLPLVDRERDSLWMLPGYMDGIREAGGIPFMLPLTADRDILEQIAADMDGLLFTGGQDVSPAIYHEAASPSCGETCAERDEMEQALFALAMARDMPVLGICRGIQFINAVLGGSLYQDLPTEHPSGTEHHQSPPYDRGVHGVTLVEGSPLQTLLGKQALVVNSYHHQAIRELAPGLEAMALSEDNLVEAVRVPDRTFIWALQWHPEFSFRSDGDSRAIFAHFLARAEEFRARAR